MQHRILSALGYLLLFSFPASAQDDVTTQGVPPPDGGITAVVMGVSGPLITVLDATITIDTTGAVFHNRRGYASIAEVKPGLQIGASIRNPQAPPGSILRARSVMIFDAPAGSLNGPVQSVDVAAGAITILGLRVLVSQATRIDSLRPEKTTLADLRPGQQVALQVTVNGSALTAETIQLTDSMIVTIGGMLKSLAATSAVVTTPQGVEMTVIVNAQTTIDPTVAVGGPVAILGNQRADGRLAATAILPERPLPVRPIDPNLLEGTVKSISDVAWVIMTADGREVTVIIDDETMVNPSIKVGDRVYVAIRSDRPGVAFAFSRIETMPPPD